MERWTSKQFLESPLPKGSEDVTFKKTPESTSVVKAHAFVLATQSEVFADQIYPLSEGQSFPIVILKSLHEERGHDRQTRPGEQLCSLEQAEAVSSSIEKTMKSIPGKNRVIEAAEAFDLNPLKAQLVRILSPGTDVDRLLDDYRKFLALKVRRQPKKGEGVQNYFVS